MQAKRTVTILCPLCEISFEPSVTKTNICPQCLISQQDITKSINRNETIQFCTYCRRYSRPPWVLCERESKELLSICLKKIKGLENMKIIETNFIFTEFSTRVIKIRLVVQKEIMNETSLQQTLVVEFYEEYKQCVDCRKEFTPHTWISSIQLRQRVDHKKTFYHLEQQIIQNHMQEKILRLETTEGGIDIFFKSQQNAKQLVEFITNTLPVRVKHSSELVSQDLKSNTSNTKHTYSVEIPKICKDNMIVIPQKLANQLGGIGRIQICYKLSSLIHIIDPFTQKCSEINPEKYFQNELEIDVFDLKSDGVEFTVVDVDKIVNQNLNESFLSSSTNHFLNRVCEISVMKINDTQDFTVYQVRSHLGGIVSVGQTVLGFDLLNMNNSLNDITKKPDIIIISVKREKSKKKKKGNPLQRIKNQPDGEEEQNQKKSKQKQSRIFNKYKIQVSKQQEKDDQDYDEYLNEIEDEDEESVQMVKEPQTKQQVSEQLVVSDEAQQQAKDENGGKQEEVVTENH